MRQNERKHKIKHPLKPKKSNIVSCFSCFALAVMLIITAMMLISARDQVILVRALATAGSNFKTGLKQIRALIDNQPYPHLVRVDHIDRIGWTNSFPNENDQGFILVSSVDPKERHCIIRLVRIRDGRDIIKIVPNWAAITSKITDKPWAPRMAYHNYRAIHPLLMPNGDIFFNLNNGLVRLDSSKSFKETVFDLTTHHSVELADDGSSIMTCGVAHGFYSNNKNLARTLRDDSIMEIGQDGVVKYNKSFCKILSDNNLEHLVFGYHGMNGEIEDPIHLNQVSVAQEDGIKWVRGDLLISARHLSSIFLYSPSENKIKWHQAGPWKNQHSVHFIDRNRIGLFDNNVYGYSPRKAIESNFVRETDINRVFVIDFSSGIPVVTEPFKKLLELPNARPRTVTEGRAQVLPDGGLFIEETNHGRLLRFSKSELMWSKVNTYDENHIGILNWCRYLPADTNLKIVD
jgi:hypothetical protein